MPLSPMIVIGCGGSGGKVVLNLRHRLEEELRRKKWTEGIPTAWQLKWIDTPAVAEQHAEFGPALPQGDYLPLATTDLYDQIDAALVYKAGQRLDRLAGWRPTPHLRVSVKEGAGQMRAVGRAVSLTQTAEIAKLVTDAVNETTRGAKQLAQLSAHLSGEVEGSGPVRDPFIIVISSLAGGTGAGIMLDVCDLVRASNVNFQNRIFGFMFTAEIFRDISADAGMPSNTLASVNELMSGFMATGRQPEPIYGVVGAQASTGSGGPSYPYIVGLQPLGGGAPLSSPSDCYRALTETLVASMINEDFAQRFQAHEIGNFDKSNTVDKRMTRFDFLNQPPGPGGLPRCGVVSSFGSARVSVGSARFAEWAVDRMSRSLVDHVVSGWRGYGLSLLEESRRATATDSEIIDFLVDRDRTGFFDQCGLWEEDEPNGTRHDQVVEGLLSQGTLARLTTEFNSSMTAELVAGGQKNASGWSQLIEQAMQIRETAFLTTVRVELEQGSTAFADGVVPKLAGSVSEWMARFGLPVTNGLVSALRAQCLAAIDQLKGQASEAGSKSSQNVSSFVAAAFQQLGNGKCAAGSSYVEAALKQAFGPLGWKAMRLRYDAATEMLRQVVTKVLDPIVSELTQVGQDLTHPRFVERLQEWPEGAGVSPLYAPPPSDFCLLKVSQWDTEYHRLLSESTRAGDSLGSADIARSLIGAGGFTYGSAADRHVAPDAVQFSAGDWRDRNAVPVKITIALRPDDVLARARLWMRDDNHPLGRFISAGLSEYLDRDSAEGRVSDHQARLDSFGRALAGALTMARPLFRIENAVFQDMHPGKDLETSFAAEQFPFSSSHPARATVEQQLFEYRPVPTNGWCLDDNTQGVESVLLMTLLSSAVQPAVVASLYEPIARRWSEIVSGSTATRSKAIQGFWTYNRARLLTESLPITQTALDAMLIGWYTGRFLGLITDPTEKDPMTIRFKEDDSPRVAQFPWPLLRHGATPQLHSRLYKLEWLPAILEHIGLATMMLNQNKHVLDAYEQLFLLGRGASGMLTDWVQTGVGPLGNSTDVRMHGDTPAERKADALLAFNEVREELTEQASQAARKTAAAYETFMTIPFGSELIPTILAAIGEMERQIDSANLSGSRA